MTTLHHDTEFKVEKIGLWIVVNDRRFGFPMPGSDGVNYIVVHTRRLGQFGKEQGFYVPRPLLRLNLIFEIKLNSGKYAHYIYRKEQRQRLLRTPPEVFVSLARLEFIKDAEHYTRPPYK